MLFKFKEVDDMSVWEKAKLACLWISG